MRSCSMTSFARFWTQALRLRCVAVSLWRAFWWRIGMELSPSRQVQPARGKRPMTSSIDFLPKFGIRVELSSDFRDQVANRRDSGALEASCRSGHRARAPRNRMLYSSP